MIMTALLFSCECATCAVPEAYRELFRGAEDAVASPEGWEPGALNLAQAFSMRFRTPLVHADVTRLLINLENDGDARWSRFSIKLPENTRAKLIDRHEKPYRTQLRQRIAGDMRRHAAVLHLMVHTDEETQGEVILETSAGAKLAEQTASGWLAALTTGDLRASHRRNDKGPDLATALATEFPADAYAQIRLRVSQSFFLNGKPWKWETLKKFLMDGLQTTLVETAS
jgi:hypothetical protein